MSAIGEELLATRVDRCQACRSSELESVLHLGSVPPVNQMVPVGQEPSSEASFPLELLYCSECHLVQIGCEVAPSVLFPPEYPYTSGSTRILRANFADLFEMCRARFGLEDGSFVVDVGSNDGTLLAPFLDGGCRVLGVEPTENAETARERGIPTEKRFFGLDAAKQVVADHGRADLVTATNVFAHMPDVGEKTEGVLALLDEKGVFVSESHYLLDLIETLQFDTIYHEHLRYYSLHSLKRILESSGLEVFHVERIETHGGSIRVFAGRGGVHQRDPSVQDMLDAEADFGLLTPDTYKRFAGEVLDAKQCLLRMLQEMKASGKRICGIGAPSRASTLIAYTGLDHHQVECILEISGSHKIGKYMPGTRIPVLEESVLFGDDQPDCAILFSWHIGDELIRNLSAKGYQGDFLVPLPSPRIADRQG